MCELAVGQAPVLTSDDRTEPSAREDHFKILDPIPRQHGHAVACGHAVRAQTTRKTAYALAQLCVRPHDLAIDNRARIRRFARP